MAINLSGQAIKDVRVAGVQAQRVMLGTGTTAVEVWSAALESTALAWMPFRSSLTEVISELPVTASVLGTVTHDSEQAVFAGAGRIKVEPFINFSSTFTVSMWVRTASTGTEWRTIAQALVNATNEWWVGCTDNVNVGWRNNSGVVELWTSGQVINDGQWHHVTFSVERAPTNFARVELRVWIDGVQRGYKLSTTQPAAVAASLPVYLGGNVDGPSFAGRIDDVAVWDRALSPAEVAQVWQASLPPRYTGVHTGPQVQVGTSLTLALSHTVTQSGRSRIQGVGAWASSANARQIQVRVNGATVADQTSSTSGVDPVATSADLILATGDVVELWARHSNFLGSNRAVTPTLTFT